MARWVGMQAIGKTETAYGLCEIYILTKGISQ